ncbi:nucleotidyltransferase family protein [uncultured Propionivibrio sp.]|uniref:nucleotidyltransferase family protein n=1 Tax=uncultured Propionivibrio sp. TaxID=426737 RepID=UPI0029C034C8|nr:nucleotidyltransferase family protein [uncultured Propionivibrio sp.]
MTEVTRLSETLSSQWEKALVPESATLTDAIRCLNEAKTQIALVVAADRVLVGTVTDGDIRRGLLRGVSMESPAASVMQRSPLVVTQQVSREAVFQLMQANRIHQLPVVDAERRAVGLHLWHDLAATPKRDNQMVIMAGGKGTRLRPHTDNCPKPLLPVSGKPMLEHIIERAKSNGFHRFVFSVHYLGHMIEEYFGDGARWDVNIEYLYESEPLGTAGAIALLRDRPESAFLVSNGDVLTDINYGDLLDFHLRHGSTATMAARLYEWQHPFGVIQTKGVDIVGFEEKPVLRNHINAGIYVLEPQAIELLQAGVPCDMPTLFGRLQERGRRTIVYPMHEPWLDVGRTDDYLAIQSSVRKDQ